MRTRLLFLGMVSFFLIVPRITTAQYSRDEKFGYFADRTMVASQMILLNESVKRGVSEIGNRVAEHSSRPEVKYTFRVINDPVINAFAASEGFVYVTTGLLDIVESEDELAAVLGHEIAHVSQRHQMKFIYAAYRRQIAGQVFGVLAGAAMGAAMGSAAQSASSAAYAESATRQAVDLGFKMGEALGNAMYMSMVEGYGKKQEFEADALGIQYSRDAGYDPNALVVVFKRLISVRDRLGLNRENYISNLMNAEPGLEARMRNIEFPGGEEKTNQNGDEEEP